MTYRIGCGGNFTTPNGFFASPSYPDTYPRSVDCVYTISQPLGTFVTVKILFVDISDEVEGNDDMAKYFNTKFYKHCGCGLAYLEVREGASETSPLIDGFCGKKIPLPMTLQTKNDVDIR